MKEKEKDWNDERKNETGKNQKNRNQMGKELFYLVSLLNGISIFMGYLVNGAHEGFSCG